MDQIICHVMPTFRCNQHCSYCYLSKQDTNTLSLSIAEKRLKEIIKSYTIERINVYGGELGTLSDSYLTELFSICKKYTGNINAITNLMRPELLSRFADIEWSVSVNEERPDYKATVSYLLTHPHDSINISQVVTPSILRMGAKKALAFDSMLGKRVEFLRYCVSDNHDRWCIGNREYEQFLIDVLYVYQQYDIDIQNLYDLNDCMEKRYNSFADSNIFIQPDGTFSCVSYRGQKESFLPISNIKDLQKIVEKEKKMSYNEDCTKCKYYGHCYAEHLHTSKKGDQCCGLIDLLRYYEENIYQDNRILSTSL